MTIADVINGSFEGLASIAVVQHCLQLSKDKQVKGVSIPAIVFFTSWGFWNMYYYPSLNQWASGACGVLVCLANCNYIRLLLKYRSKS